MIRSDSATIPPDAPFTRTTLPLLVLAVLGMGVLSLILGQDGNWDLRNYHWYNAYAFWTGRLLTDVAPAQIPSFYNPTLDVPFYLLASTVPAWLAGFILGLVQGLNVVPLYGMAWTLLTPGLMPVSDSRQRAGAALAVAVIGLLGGGHIGLVGTTFYDNVISLLVLGSAWIVVAGAGPIFDGPLRPAFVRVALAGLLVGSGVGLKQPTVVFAVGLCFAFLFLGGSVWRRLFTAFFFGLGVLAGMAIFSGHWMLFLWQQYDNPLFPYFNDVFRSAMGTQASYRDDKFIPHGLWSSLSFPLTWLLDPKKVGEIPFFDLRVPLSVALLLLTPLLLLVRRIRDRADQPALPQAATYLLVATALSYVVWLKLFAIYRYLIPLELLAPLVIVLCVAQWPLSLRTRGIITLALLVLVTVTARPGNWGRIPWTARYVEVTVPTLPDPDHSLIVMTGFAPTSFLLERFPPQIPALRLHSYLIHPDHGPVGINRRMAERIAAHTGPIYLIVAPWELWTIDNLLPAFGLTADPAACQPLLSNLDEPMRFCPVSRRPGTGPADAAFQP
jgi:hypothetical protein